MKKFERPWDTDKKSMQSCSILILNILNAGGSVVMDTLDRQDDGVGAPS